MTEEWLSKKEAAKRAGVSVDRVSQKVAALNKKIKVYRLAHEKGDWKTAAALEAELSKYEPFFVQNLEFKTNPETAKTRLVKWRQGSLFSSKLLEQWMQEWKDEKIKRASAGPYKEKGRWLEVNSQPTAEDRKQHAEAVQTALAKLGEIDPALPNRFSAALDALYANGRLIKGGYYEKRPRAFLNAQRNLAVALQKKANAQGLLEEFERFVGGEHEYKNFEAFHNKVVMEGKYADREKPQAGGWHRKT